MKILIVDDETLARDRLRSLITELYPMAEIYEAENGLRALQHVNKQTPDIVFLDIRMPGMDGLETAQHIAKMQSPSTVVFTTAYQEHALSAFDSNAVDYLLKPIRKERLKTALEKAELISGARIDKLRQAVTEETMRTHLSTLIQGNIVLIPVDEICYLKAEQKYVTVGSPDGELLIDESLKSLEQEFIECFIRVHRNALVAIDKIKALQKCVEGNYEICLNGVETTIQVSRRHLSDVKHHIRNKK